MTNEILIDAFERIMGVVHRTVDGLDETQLTFRPTPTANSIAWLVWHLARIQDDHIADVAGTPQRWETWFETFSLPFERSATGYGQTPEEVGAVIASPETLLGYFDDVHTATITYLKNLNDEDYERIVDTNWDPPVTLAVRLISVIADDLQHAGQAAYVRGLIPELQ